MAWRPIIGSEMTSRVSSPIFVGRAVELAALADALDRAEAGTASCVFVGGEAGIGKSRLMSEFAAYGRARGALVLEGACISLGTDEGLPFAPIAGVLRGLLRQTGREALEEHLDAATSELTRLAPGLGQAIRGPVSRTAQAEWAQTRLFEGLLTLLGRIGEGAPVIVILEDLHWADRSSRDIVGFLARNARSERLCLVGTYRTDELQQSRPLRTWLAEMKRVPHAERLDLARFDRHELATQLSAIRGIEASPELVESIATRSGGNPFFAEELLASAIGGDADALPETLREILMARVSSLSETAQRLLRTAAVAGTMVDDDLLGTVAEIDEDERTAALRDLISNQLLIQEGSPPGATYAFRHALLQEAVYHDLLANERQKLHAAYASALEGLGVPEGVPAAPHFSAIAHHASAAGERSLALRSWIQAGRASSDAYGFAEAAQSYQRALDVWSAVPASERPGDVDHVQVLYDASVAFGLGNEFQRASELARMAVDEFDGATDPARAAMLWERLAIAVYSSGGFATGVSFIEEAAGLVRGHPPSTEAATIFAVQANFTWASGEYRRASHLAREAIAIAREVDAGYAEASALNTLGSSLAVLGDCDRGLAMLRESLELARAGGFFDRLSVSPSLSSTLLDCGQPEEALAAALDTYAWAQRHGMTRTSAGWLGLFAGHVLTGLGRWSEAQDLFEKFGATLPTGLMLAELAAFNGALAVRTGDAQAARWLAIAEEEGQPLQGDAGFTGRLFGALIEQAIIQARFDEGRAKADEGLGWLAATDDIRYRSGLLQRAIRLESEAASVARAERDRVAEERAVSFGLARLASLRELIGTIENPASPVFGEALGNAAIAEAEATMLLDRPDPKLWAAAADAFAARRLPHEVAWCRYRQAEATLARKGSRTDAARALGEAWSICAELGANPLRESVEALGHLARIGLPSGQREPDEFSVGRGDEASSESIAQVGDPFGLTARERDVLSLVAAGYTNRRIAETLFISQNTAGVHVSNILGKLGVSNRVEAASVALRLHLADTLSRPEKSR